MSKGKANFTLPGAEQGAFAARLRSFTKERGTVDRLSKEIGASPSAIRQWAKGETEPSRDFLVALAETLGVSLKWLTMGSVETSYDCEIELSLRKSDLKELIALQKSAKSIPEREAIIEAKELAQKRITLCEEELGSLHKVETILAELRNPSKPSQIGSKHLIAPPGEDLEGPIKSNFMGVPRYDAHLAAGGGAFNERAKVIDYIPFTREFMANKLGRSSAEGLVVLEARGDSMEPTIGGGDLVLIDQHLTGLSDGIIAFVLDDTALVKRVRSSPDGVEVISDNHMYPPYRLEQNRLDELHVIGRVRWIGKAVDG